MNAGIPEFDKGGRLSVAPMMDWTDRHFRFFFRGISRHTLLYTEMITAVAILRGDRERLLGFDDQEQPIVLQLGGNNLTELVAAARIAYVDYGYKEINLNVGCPSNKVQGGNFGACMMAYPEVVGDIVAAMRATVPVPITVKHRIGIDDHNEYEFLTRFVETVATAGCERFIVHARVALLKGLSPKANRHIPPLRYQDVFRLKRDYPELQIEINGGIRDLVLARGLMAHCDGVMIGRAAYENPYLFASADHDFYESDVQPMSRRQVIERMIPYLENLVMAGNRAKTLTRHMLGLMQGLPGARNYRRCLSDHKLLQTKSPTEIFRQAVHLIPATLLDACNASSEQLVMLEH